MIGDAGSSLAIGVDAWCHWEPHGGQSVCSHYRGGEIARDELERPQLESVPPIQRRRLSPLARVTFHVLDQCKVPASHEPLIFSSVMGEIRRTQGILDSIASDSTVSPAAFSLSVHNSVAGLWSLIYGNKTPMLSLAPIDNSPVPALLEAAGILAEGRYQGVLVVYCEEDYPDFYRPFMAGPVAPTATALRLVSPGEQSGSLVLSLKQDAGGISGDAAGNHRSLMQVLQKRSQYASVVEQKSVWQLAAVG